MRIFTITFPSIFLLSPCFVWRLWTSNSRSYQDMCNESVMGKSFRIRVGVDITRPLKREITLKLGEKMIKKILFKYERL